MFEEYHEIIIVVLIIIVVVCCLHKNRELFEVTTDVQQYINNAVNSKYNIDIAAMRNMGQVASNILLNEDSLTIPANTTTMKNLTAENININGKLTVTQQAALMGGLVAKGNIDIQGNVNTSDLNVLGNLTVDNTKFNNLLPFNTIILWSESLDKLPPGWAPCTGKKYKYKPNVAANQIKFIEDDNGFETPYIPPPPWANDATRQRVHYVIRMNTNQ